MLARLFACCCLVVLVGCGGRPPEPPKFPELRYSHLAPLPVPAARLEIASLYVPTFKAPNIEHVIPIPPERVARQWAQDRLQPTGRGDLVLRFVIEEAGVVEQELKTEGGLSGIFKVQPTERYTATLAAAAQLTEESGNVLAQAKATVTRTATANEDSSVNDRDRIWFELVEELGKEFDRQMTDAVLRYLIPVRP